MFYNKISIIYIAWDFIHGELIIWYTLLVFKKFGYGIKIILLVLYDYFVIIGDKKKFTCEVR